MRITKLEGENFKRLRAVSINPAGAAVIIGGDNEVGKASVLDLIEAVLGGKKHAPAEPIRRGQAKARGVVETDTISVTRTWTEKGSALEVRGKDGSRFSKPQQMLDELIGPLSYDPLDFARGSATEQSATLRAIVGLGFETEDAERVALYDKRTRANREIKRLGAALLRLPSAPPGPPGEIVSVAELTVELERRQAVNASHDTDRQVLVNLRADGSVMQSRIEELETELEGARAGLKALTVRGVALRVLADAFVDEDAGEVLEQIRTAEDINAAIRARSERAGLEAELSACNDESTGYTEWIDAIDAAKLMAAASAEYPIDGLALTGDGVMLGGLPFEQASQSQRLRVSVAIGLALNPGLQVMLIRDGALLDEKSLELVASMAEDAGAQVWIEVVGDRDGVTIVIEDGSVAIDRVAP